MEVINVINPFNAPVYHEKIVSSTMDLSRRLASSGEAQGELIAAHGTVIAADFQESGRGRIRGRTWETEKEMSLPFTILLHYPRTEDIPPLLTLRAGLAVSTAIEDFAFSLKDLCLIKWPNDIMINSKKVAGILCEADCSVHAGGVQTNSIVHLGIGINVAQKEFPFHLSEKAISIAVAAGKDFSYDERFSLLEKILKRLYNELETAADNETLISRIEQRLYKKGGQVVFIDGAADSGKTVNGRLAGIGKGGELLIQPDNETAVRSFITGELKIL